MDYELALTISAFCISIISLAASIFFSRKAQEHNRKSVLPIPYLDRSDFENLIHLRIYNKGTGPMVVSELKASHPAGKVGAVVDIIPVPPNGFRFSNFSRFAQAENRTIRPGEFNDLLVAKFDSDNDIHREYRKQLRIFLKDVSVRCTYTDVYNSTFLDYKADCKWFGRHFA